MAGWNHNNANWKQKACAVCGTEFTPRSGVNKFCSDTCRGRWKYVTGAASTENQYEKISGNWRRYFSRLLNCGGGKRTMLSVSDLLEVLESQMGRCALTGEPMTCTLSVGHKTGTNASIDRIKAGGTYTKDNIRLVCASVNKWRGDLPTEEFVLWCKKVVAYSERS